MQVLPFHFHRSFTWFFPHHYRKGFDLYNSGAVRFSHWPLENILNGVVRIDESKEVDVHIEFDNDGVPIWAECGADCPVMLCTHTAAVLFHAYFRRELDKYGDALLFTIEELAQNASLKKQKV
ncbi:MAG: hypothetical protein ACLFR1_16305 [Spirochaetia bacterium]